MRARERYTLVGEEGFGEAELIALVLGTAAGGLSARSIGQALLDRFGSLARIATAPVGSLALVRGVGPARAVRLHAALALGRRACAALPGATDAVTSAADAARWFVPALEGLDHEEFHALYLDRRGRPLAYRRLSVGSDAFTVVDSRRVLRPAVELGATGVLVAHNHPSGDPEPSGEDRAVTRQLVGAGRIVGVRVLDHLVIGAGRWTSLAERGEVTV